jgi:hypothetical protein
MLQSGRYVRIIVGVLLTLIILIYAGTKSINLLSGPKLTLERPKNGETVSSDLLTIQGYARNIAFLTLNDRRIFVNDTGVIFDQLLLYEGYNIITLKAKDKFGRETSLVREVIYKPN